MGSYNMRDSCFKAVPGIQGGNFQLDIDIAEDRPLCGDHGMGRGRGKEVLVRKKLLGNVVGGIILL